MGICKRLGMGVRRKRAPRRRLGPQTRLHYSDGHEVNKLPLHRQGEDERTARLWLRLATPRMRLPQRPHLCSRHTDVLGKCLPRRGGC
eukprot:scaffold228083_cov32-Tisochrysis_lutea.AAC.3